MSGRIPWWAKMGAKIALSRLPFRYDFWKRVSLFEHGSMEVPEYAFSVFKGHYENVEPETKFVSLELGPGDSLFSALIAYAFGGKKAYLVDVGRFATEDVQRYRKMEAFLKEKGMQIPCLSQANTVNDILRKCSSHYLTDGLDSLRRIPSSSVDFIWSQAVLEHIRRSEFLDTMRELRRIVRDDGMCSHNVDLKDHLEGGLNNLRFSHNTWESELIAASGFYTNRIRYPRMMDLFREAHFEPRVIRKKTWHQLPTPRSAMDEEFDQYSDVELCVSEFEVVLIPA